MTFSQTIPKRPTTTNTSKPTDPDETIENPLDKDAFVTKIEIIPNYNFAEKGIIEVSLDDHILFSNKDNSEIFSDLELVDVPLKNNKMLNNSKITIKIWNDVDSEEIAVSINTTISEEDTAPSASSSAIGRNVKNRGVTDQGTKTTADGGSGIVATVYTCPLGKKAKVLIFETRPKVTGSASQVRLLVRGQRIERWLNDTQNPNVFQGTTNRYPFPSDPRKVWSDGLYPEWNLTRRDLKDEELDENETIAYDGNFSGNFNATIDFAFTILETRKV